MGVIESPFKPLSFARLPNDLQAPIGGASPGGIPAFGQGGHVSTACFHGFDLNDSPVLSGLVRFPGELVPARTTIALSRRMVGAVVAVLHEEGDWTRPIVIGVLQDHADVREPTVTRASIEARVDDERLTLTAEREIVLRCGDASITLTRAGKIIIKGNYIVSRSNGYNKIKGAAVDIN